MYPSHDVLGLLLSHDAAVTYSLFCPFAERGLHHQYSATVRLDRTAVIRNRNWWKETTKIKAEPSDDVCRSKKSAKRSDFAALTSDELVQLSVSRAELLTSKKIEV